jgi:HK97 gp10 family phage protein
LIVGGNFKITVKGDKELRAAMRKLAKTVQWQINRKAVMVAGKVIRQSVLDHIPSAGIRKRTGNLIASVQQATDGARMGKDVAVTTIYTQKKGGFHAHLLEFGHKLVLWQKQPHIPGGRFGKPPKFFNRLRRRGFVKARPFFAPAVDDSEQKVVDTYAAELWKGIQRAI